jgi:hypothetical protein
MEKIKITENNTPLFSELKNLGCEFRPSEEAFFVPTNKKPNVSEVLGFYSAKPKNLTPYQKKLKIYLEKNLPLDIIIKKTDKGFFVVDENGLIPKSQMKEVLEKIGLGIIRTMNNTRYLISTEGGFGKL